MISFNVKNQRTITEYTDAVLFFFISEQVFVHKDGNVFEMSEAATRGVLTKECS